MPGTMFECNSKMWKVTGISSNSHLKLNDNKEDSIFDCIIEPVNHNGEMQLGLLEIDIIT
jgi:hypothetical protein